MNDIILSNRPIDQITLVDTLEKRGNISRIGGIGYITGLIRGVPSSSNYKYYLDIVKRDGLLRKLIKAGTDILTDAATSEDGAKSLQIAEEKIFKISDEKIDRHS
jgi:replicative DNA helicase